MRQFFGSLHQLRQIRRSLPTATFQSLTVASGSFATGLYVDSAFAGWHCFLPSMTTSFGVERRAALLVYNLKPSEHITEVLISLH
jgi:hypothetical protein